MEIYYDLIKILFGGILSLVIKEIYSWHSHKMRIKFQPSANSSLIDANHSKLRYTMRIKNEGQIKLENYEVKLAVYGTIYSSKTYSIPFSKKNTGLPQEEDEVYFPYWEETTTYENSKPNLKFISTTVNQKAGLEELKKLVHNENISFSLQIIIPNSNIIIYEDKNAAIEFLWNLRGILDIKDDNWYKKRIRKNKINPYQFSKNCVLSIYNGIVFCPSCRKRKQNLIF